MLLFLCNHHRTNHHNTVITRDKYSCEIPFDQIKLTDGDLVNVAQAIPETPLTQKLVKSQEK